MPHRPARSQLTPRAVLYLRVSTEEQTVGMSLAVQERDCRQFCERQGIAIDRVFIEPGESAKTDARPAFQAMVAYAKAGGITHCVVWKLDRFSRLAQDALVYRAALSTVGIVLNSATEPIGDDPVGRLMGTFLAGIAEYDNDVKAQRVIASMARLQEAGYWTHQAPLGYALARDDGRPTLVHDRATAPLLRSTMGLIADRHATPLQALAIAHEQGLRTRGGRLVSPSRWYEMLADPVYCGLIRTKLTGNRSFRGRWEPIITAETWSALQQVLKAERTVRLRRTVETDFPLRGFLHCGCGSTMTASLSTGRSGQKHAYYHCRKSGAEHARLRVDQADEVLAEALGEVSTAFAPMVACIRAFTLATVRQEQAEAAALAETQIRRAQQLDGMRGRLMDAMLAGAVSQEAYVAKDTALRAELAEAKQQGGQAMMTDGEIEAVMIEAERILADLPAVSNRLDRTSRHALMRLLWPRGLKVGRDGVRTAASGCVFADLTSGIAADSGLAPHAGLVSNLLTIYRRIVEIAA